jgi:cytoskeleton protein RodZ
MFTVSEMLQRARLDQRIDLATVAAGTKIKAKYLQAIEADDRKSLPGAFFYKSFVHQYATFLGVDTRAIDAEIDRVLSADVPVSLPRAAEQRAVKLSSRPRTSSRYFSYAALVLMLVACVGIDGWWHESRVVATEKIESRAPVVENTKLQRAPSFATGRPSLASVSGCCYSEAGRACGWFESRACFDCYGRDLDFGFFGRHASLLRPSRGRSDKDYRRQRTR